LTPKKLVELLGEKSVYGPFDPPISLFLYRTDDDVVPADVCPTFVSAHITDVISDGKWRLAVYFCILKRNGRSEAPWRNRSRKQGGESVSLQHQELRGVEQMYERGIQDVRMPFVPTLVVIIIRFWKDYIGWLAFRLPYSIPTSSCWK
jgi:hypothetical protein